MAKNARFWRNVTLIALAHVAVILGLIHWSLAARNSANPQSIVWLSSAQDLAAEELQPGASPAAEVSISPPQQEPPNTDEVEGQKPVVIPKVFGAKSEIELPTATPKPTPTATPTPKPNATPTVKPKTSPKSLPKPSPKKTLLAKASPRPSFKAKSSPTKSAEKAKNADVNAEKKKIAQPAPAKTGSASQPASKAGSAAKGGHEAGGTRESEFGWYGNMLHDRFYSAWIQPTTNIATGTKISTFVKVRIEKDGRVSKFEIIKPSENVVVNESVAAIAKRVTEVDPPPDALINGDHYDVKINFELNTDHETTK
jgi:outer membrane biosynthesis protein TonB